jgi:superfamily II DNA or RNA helicase
MIQKRGTTLTRKNSWTIALLRHIKSDYTQNAINKGRNYALNRRVLKLYLKEDDNLVSRVSGSVKEPYTIHLRFSHQFVEAYCSCPVGIYCKHAYATALTALYGAWISGLDLGKRETSLFPQAWLEKKSAPDPSFFENVRILWGEAETGVEPGNAGNNGPEWWRVFLETGGKNKRKEIIETAIRSRFVNPRTYFSDWETRNYIIELLDISNPFEILRAYETTVQEMGRRLYLRVMPPDPRLNEFLNSEEAQNINAQMEEQEGLRLFLSWLEQRKNEQPAGSACRAEIVWFPQKDSYGIPVLSYQVLLTTNRLNKNPRSPQALKQLATDIHHGVRHFPWKEKKIIEWISERREMDFGTSYHSRQDEDSYAYPVSDVLAWMNLWGDYGIIRWRNGGLARFDPRPAKLSVSRTDIDSFEWIVVFPSEGPDEGQRLPLRETDCVGERKDLYNYENDRRIFVRRGDVLFRLETGGMDSSILSGIRKLRRIPFKQIKGSIAGSHLVEWLRLSDDPWCRDFAVQYVPVRPVMEFRLQEASNLSVVCRARASEGREFFKNPQGEWILCSPKKKDTRNKEDDLEELSLSSSQNKKGGAEESQNVLEKDISLHALAVLPRSEDVKPLEEWLDLLIPGGAIYGMDRRGYGVSEWKLTRRETAQLLNLWEKRPFGAEWLGNRKFKNLVTPRSLPRWNIKIEPSGVNWLSVSLEMEKEIEGITLEEIEQILKQDNEELIILPGKGVYRRQDLLEFKQNMDVLTDIGLEPAPGAQRLHVLQLGGEPGRNLMALAGREEGFRNLADNARKILTAFQGVPSSPVDEKTRRLLRPYQHQGVDFIGWACQTFGGAILADDMGLGKTFQVLAMLNALRSSETSPPPSLVICPASVVHNWQREADLFAPNLKLGMIESGPGRHRIYERMEEYDLLITNYALARRDKDVLAGRKWYLVCVDEAQAIKNPHASITQVVKDIEGRYRMALTGTPIENRILDLWSIVDFTIPGFLPGLPVFEKKWRESDMESFYRLLRARLRPILLRRMKSEVAPDLPPRIEERRDCEMTPKQKKAYLAELRKTRLMLESAQTKKIAGKERIQILAALTRLRQICCDPEIIGLKDTGSGKTVILLELVKEILGSGHKVLVFSQFVRMLNRLKAELESCGIPFYMLTGQTRKRKELIDRFEKDRTPGVFLISLKAGGLGLNLVSASHVILFDPWWNPAVEAQAIDRTHRIGQDKTVVAFRLVTLGTIEERIMDLQEKKRKLVRNILEEEAFNRTLTRADFAFLLE